ncbi:winged helix-turn-helix transcriptional regulator [Amnibacterium setariae]|uniref:winged helix-turn-helix transcriptional regulator n=1 Tax=Amnibacterium setariae TaxID=2306585 RepID=UPI001F34A50B|nr:helix-turn-helix domain-containing protein [Amnibacterium setariae]
MTEHEVRACDAAMVRAFEVLGKRWNGMILSVLAQGPAAFSELRRALGTISDSMLSDRLSELASAGLIERSVDPGPPVAVSYGLTASGRGLAPAFDLLAGWARQSLGGAAPAAAER